MKAFVAFFALATVALAAPEADPQYLYAGYPAVYANPHATAGLTTYANGAVTPTDTLSVQAAKAQHFAAKAYDYATRPVYGVYGAPHFIGKREAEAEADPQYLYSPYYASPHASLGLTAYPNGAVTPTQTLAVQAATAQHFAAKASIYATQPYYGYYGAHYLGKREAEAEPKADSDAQYFYGAGYGYPYANYGFVNTYGAYPYRFIGKREAEAEPKADAQFLYYGGYPYATYGAYRGYYGGYPYATTAFYG